MITQEINITDSLQWRYATKKFKKDVAIPEKEMRVLLNSLRLSPSSMGLQPYHFIRVKDEIIREELREHSFNQSQITDASELIIFAAKSRITQSEVEKFASLNAKILQRDDAYIEKQVKRLSNYLEKFDEASLFNWTSKQAYIAMGILLTSAAQLKIDACPMEGIEGEEYDRILDLEPLNLKTISVITLGYRSNEDGYQWEPKVRKPLDDLISMI